MAIISQVYGTEESIAGTSLDNLANGSKVVIEVDNSVNKHIADDYDIEIAGASAGTVDIYKAGSNIATNFALATDITDVWYFVESISMVATKKKIDFRLEQLKKYNAILIVNSTGSALSATGSTVKRMGADLSNG